MKHRSGASFAGILAILTVMAGMAATALADQVAKAGADSDRAAIRQAALDYAEGWYQGDAARMERALHPDLAKRTIKTDPKSGWTRLDQMSALSLINATRAGYGKKTPKAERIKTVTILDRFHDTASVKLVMRDWIDYLHVVKWRGQWKIVNVLWLRKPQQK
ncbi:MAG: nuclear transport factor 2 family protein [Proteobacteria bacterium]|nr:nuclear transport factor 2 family protein [Pseudomonadota bacterium]